MKVEGEEWRVVGIYAREGIKKVLEEIEEWLEEREERVRTVIGGDFNARKGEEGRSWQAGEKEGKEEEMSRSSKDKKIDKEGSC